MNQGIRHLGITPILNAILQLISIVWVTLSGSWTFIPGLVPNSPTDITLLVASVVSIVVTIIAYKFKHLSVYRGRLTSLSMTSGAISFCLASIHYVSIVPPVDILSVVYGALALWLVAVVFLNKEHELQERKERKELKESQERQKLKQKEQNKHRGLKWHH